MMPGEEGLSLCWHIHETSQTPFMQFLLSKQSAIDHPPPHNPQRKHELQSVLLLGLKTQIDGLIYRLGFVPFRLIGTWSTQTLIKAMTIVINTMMVITNIINGSLITETVAQAGANISGPAFSFPSS